MKNKKGANFTVGVVLAIFLFLFLTVVFGGSIGKIWDITQFLNKIPAVVYVVIGFWILFKWMSK